MRRYILILVLFIQLPFLLQAELAESNLMSFPASLMQIKPQEAAIQGVLQRNVKLPLSEGKELSGFSSRTFSQYPFLRAIEDKAVGLLASGYYPIYVTLPRDLILRYYFLKRLEQYFQARGQGRAMHVGSLFSYIAKYRTEPFKVQPNLENLFVVPMLNPKRIRPQQQFESSKKFNTENWREIAPYVSQKTLQDLVDFLNNFIETDMYDENIPVQFIVPKNFAQDMLVGRFKDKEYSVEKFFDKSEDTRCLNNGYVSVTFHPRANYDDIKAMIMHSHKNTFRPPLDLHKKFTPLVQKVGAEMLHSIQNPPAPLPRKPSGAVQPARAQRPLPPIPEKVSQDRETSVVQQENSNLLGFLGAALTRRRDVLKEDDEESQVASRAVPISRNTSQIVTPTIGQAPAIAPPPPPPLNLTTADIPKRNIMGLLGQIRKGKALKKTEPQAGKKQGQAGTGIQGLSTSLDQMRLPSFDEGDQSSGEDNMDVDEDWE